MTEAESNGKIVALIQERQTLRKALPDIDARWFRCLDLLRKSYATPDQITVRNERLYGAEGLIPDDAEIVEIWTKRNNTRAQICQLTRDLSLFDVDLD